MSCFCRLFPFLLHRLPSAACLRYSSAPFWCMLFRLAVNISVKSIKCYEQNLPGPHGSCSVLWKTSWECSEWNENGGSSIICNVRKMEAVEEQKGRQGFAKKGKDVINPIAHWQELLCQKQECLCTVESCFWESSCWTQLSKLSLHRFNSFAAVVG